MKNGLIFVFIDGVDGIGKTTLCETMLQTIPANQGIRSVERKAVPSTYGTLSFLRQILKDNNFKCDDFARQLLHSCDNITEIMETAYSHAIELLVEKDNTNALDYVIFDRGPMSTMSYGSVLFKRSGMKEDVIDRFVNMLGKIHFNIIEDLTFSNCIRQVYYVNLFKTVPYRSKSDGTYYEEHASANELAEAYKRNAGQLLVKYGKDSFEGTSVNVDLDELAENGITASEDIAKFLWASIIPKK